MLLLLVASLTLAAPVKSIAAPGLSSQNLDVKTTDTYLLHFSQQLQLQGGFKVITQSEIVAVLGIERQRQLLGCSDEQAGSCAAEVAQGLGVDAVVTGNVSKLGDGYLVNLKLVRSSDASAIAVFSGRPKTEAELLDFLEESARSFAEQQRPAEPAPAPKRSALPVLKWAFLGVGVVGLGLGATLIGVAHGTASQLRAGMVSSPDGLVALRNRGEGEERAGWALLAVGITFAALTVVAFLLGSSS